MKTDYIYWNTFVNYLKDNFKLNGDLTNDAKVIKETQYLWQEASKRYLKNVSARDMTEMWCDFDKKYYGSYKTWYEEFIEYLEYATDRLNLNRWLQLQMMINRAVDLLYDRWIDTGESGIWYLVVENGWSTNIKYNTKLQEDCHNEFKTTIKPLIIKNQEKETKTKNEIQN